MMPRWPRHKEDRLCHLWMDRRLTATQCAAILGVTKNAVIGKVYRMGWKRPGMTPPKPTRREIRVPPLFEMVLVPRRQSRIERGMM